MKPTVIITKNDLIISSHCFDYFEFTDEEIFHAVDNAKEAFVTPNSSKAPTVMGYIGMEAYGFVVSNNLIITILPIHEYERNRDNRNSLKSIMAELIIC